MLGGTVSPERRKVGKIHESSCMDGNGVILGNLV